MLDNYFLFCLRLTHVNHFRTTFWPNLYSIIIFWHVFKETKIDNWLQGQPQTREFSNSCLYRLMPGQALKYYSFRLFNVGISALRLFYLRRAERKTDLIILSIMHIFFLHTESPLACRQHRRHHTTGVSNRQKAYLRKVSPLI